MFHIHILLLFHLFISASPNIVQFPQNTYQLSIDQSANVTFTLSWIGPTSTFQIYGYKQGMNILSPTTYYFHKQLSNGNKSEQVILEKGTYYVRASLTELTSLLQPVSYSLKINVYEDNQQVLVRREDSKIYGDDDGNVVSVVSNSFNWAQNDYCSFQIRYNNFPNCYFKIFSRSGQKYQPILYQVSLSKDENTIQYNKLAIDSNGVWQIVFFLTPDSQIFQIITSSFIIAPNNHKCLQKIRSNDQNIKQTSILFIIVMVLAILMAVIAVVFNFCIIKKTREMRKKAKLKISYIKDNCPICLGDQLCNTYLPCKHIFHEVCIKDWYKKDQSCPTCRKKFSSKELKHHSNLRNH